jgi:DNA-binding response OmpR family regulator
MKVPKLLIVEDEVIFAWHLTGLIDDLGYQVNKVEFPGEDGFKAVEDDPPDLILLNLSLRGGFGVAETVNQIRLHTDIPIIFITGHSDKKILDGMKKIRKSIVLKKPIDSSKLRAAINSILANNFLTIP